MTSSGRRQDSATKGPPSPQRGEGKAGGPRRYHGMMAALLGGLTLAAGVLCLIHLTPLRQSPAARYVSHPVENVEVAMFCCALAALGAKLLHHVGERLACRRELLPAWDGEPAPVAEAGKLLAGLGRLPRRVQSSTLGKRVTAILDFLCRRGSAADLDDHLRALADSDADALESSYGLIRFITWAIPILGFLGTVLGITAAIAGVTPDRLENDLNTVTDGLAEAFDATALALGLTMLTMFLTYVVDRLEEGVLEAVDRAVDRHLAHRFERVGADTSGVLEAVRQNTRVLLEAVEQVVRRQAEVWAKTLAEADYRRTDEEKRQQARFSGALEAALERTLHTHAQQVAALQKQAVEGSTRLLEQLAALATGVRETGREQQAALVQVAESVTAQAEALTRLHDGGRQLVRLETALNENLNALTATQTFEQAVHSLTAAVHLLTARTTSDGRPSRLGPRPGPAAAA